MDKQQAKREYHQLRNEANDLHDALEKREQKTNSMFTVPLEEIEAQCKMQDDLRAMRARLRELRAIIYAA